jgi:hypothetical protein
VRYLSSLLLIISLFIPMLGCEDEYQPSEKKLEVHVDTFAPLGVPIYVEFNKKVASVTIMLNGAPVPAKTSNDRVYRFEVSIPDEELECMNAGDYKEYTMNIEATDEAGQSLEDFTPLNFAIVIPDYWPPRVCGVKCDPRKGSVDVDPEEYVEKLIIAFNEPLVEAEVLSTDPEFDFTLNFSEDRSVMEVRFLNYIMPYETEFRITVSATDLARNIAEDTYWFTTIERRGR